jgi:hypothetical protein
MSLILPTTVPYVFVTQVANRVAPTGARKASGFAGGDAVPAGTNNDILGILSDWVYYLSNRSRKFDAQKEWVMLNGYWNPPDDAGYTVTGPSSGTGALSMFAAIGEDTSETIERTVQSEGGYMTGGEVLGYYDANTGSGVGQVRVRVWDMLDSGAGPSIAAEYLATLTPGTSPASSNFVVVGTPTATVGPAWVEVHLILNPASGDNPAGQTVALSGVRIIWENQ